MPSVRFDCTDLAHVNFVIDNLLCNIKNILTFIYENYLNYKYLTYILEEDNAKYNWSIYLGYSTKNYIKIGLQNLGVSRFTAPPL